MQLSSDCEALADLSGTIQYPHALLYPFYGDSSKDLVCRAYSHFTYTQYLDNSLTRPFRRVEIRRLFGEYDEVTDLSRAIPCPYSVPRQVHGSSFLPIDYIFDTRVGAK